MVNDGYGWLIAGCYWLIMVHNMLNKVVNDWMTVVNSIAGVRIPAVSDG